MLQQLLNLDPPADSPPLTGTMAAWVRFHHANPHVWSLFKHFSMIALEKGAKVGARLVVEKIRWRTKIDTARYPEDFLINNSFIPYYARLLMLVDARFADFFERRDKHFEGTDEGIVLYGLMDGDWCPECGRGLIVRRGTEDLSCLRCDYQQPCGRSLYDRVM